jgi:hypothetical protein
MSKKIFLIFLTIALCIQLKAQFKAKMTDRFLIKTDLAMMALQNGYNASIEIRFAKNKTIEVGYFDGSEKFNQNQNFTQNIYNSSTEGIPKSIVNSQYTYVTLKFYQGRVIKAPIGFYFSINASYGACDFSGLAYYDDLPTFLRNPDFTNTINPYVIHNIEMIKGGVGFGFQKLISTLIYYDFTFSLNYATFNTGKDGLNHLIGNLATRYGNNLMGQQISGSSSIGLNLCFKLGYIIY